GVESDRVYKQRDTAQIGSGAGPARANTAPCLGTRRSCSPPNVRKQRMFPSGFPPYPSPHAAKGVGLWSFTLAKSYCTYPPARGSGRAPLFVVTKALARSTLRGAADSAANRNHGFVSSSASGTSPSSKPRRNDGPT